jgi:3-phenylpropionate/trans-cinnamate dioxygenase ferredoxin reductase subunit
LADADGVRASLHPGARVVVIGGGYVGLEVAASARGIGAEVTVLEAQSRVLARVAGAEVSHFYARVHREAGVTILTDVGIARVDCEDDRIVCVHGTDGQRLRADLVIAGVGMVPNIEPAQAAGLAVGAGIEVDDLSRTLDPDIVAAGDCTLQHHALYDRHMRLESVPNALEQARAAASWLCGKPRPNRSVPWFWSDQYDLKLQMAGLSLGYDRCVLRGHPSGRSFCAFYLRGDQLLAVDAVNRPAEFMLVRRALAHGVTADPRRLTDETMPLKELLVGVPSTVAGNP